MMKTLLFFITGMLFFSLNGRAGELLAQNDPAKAAPQADTASQPEPDNTVLTKEQQESIQESAEEEEAEETFLSTHKVNYFSINHKLGTHNEQAKYQISMKFRVLKPDIFEFMDKYFPVYFAYTQKSLWNQGQRSKPFEESNYNPEVFFDYPVNAAINNRIILRRIVFSPIEHESNGIAGDLSRNWDRTYVLIRFGLKTKEKLEETKSFLADKAQLYVKCWYAWGYTAQTKYLQAKGANSDFLDYMGNGEIGVSLRNFLWGGAFKNHQLDFKTPISYNKRKDSFEYVFRQQLPNMEFSLFLSYWHGYGETLQRFDQYGRRGFIGLAFTY